MSGKYGKWEALITVPTGDWDAVLEEFIAADVAWTSAVNCVASGNDLTKNAGGDGWNAGAVSVAVLTANGYAEWLVGQADGSVSCGLSVGNPGVSETEIDYSILTLWDGTIHIYENGTERGSGYGAYTSATTFRIQRIGTAITYWQKPSGGSWTLLYTSAVASTGDLLVDCSIYTEGDAIIDAVLYTGDGGTTITLTAAKTYYHSSAGNDTLDLPARLMVLLDAAGTGTYTVSVDAGEAGTGRYTISASFAEGGEPPTAGGFTLAWTDAALGLLLGFDSTLATEAIATSYTGADAAEGLWLPDGPPLSITAAFGDEIDESDRTTLMNPTGTQAWTLAYNRLRIISDLRYQAVSRAKARIAGETYGNESWQQFWRDVVDGDASYLTIGRVRIYPDADTDTTYYDYWIMDEAECRPIPLKEGWLARYTIAIKRLVRVET